MTPRFLNPWPIDVLHNDSNASGATITSVTQGALGAVRSRSNGLSVLYGPRPDANGFDTFTYTLGDGAGATDTATVDLQIVGMKTTALMEQDATLSTLEDGTLAFETGDFGFSDPQDVPPDQFEAVTVSTLPAAGLLRNDGSAVSTGNSIDLSDIQAHHLTFTPDADQTGVGYAVRSRFKFQDDGGLAGVNLDPTPNTLTIEVSPRNDVPNAVNDSLTVAEDAAATAVPVLANDSDADGDTLTITARTNGAKGRRRDQWRRERPDLPPERQLQRVRQLHLHDLGRAWRPTVAPWRSRSAPVNDHVPCAVNDSLTVAEDAGASTVPVLANDSDADGDTLTITAKTNGAHGTVAISAGGSGLTYQPNLNYSGPDSFTYTTSDGTATDSASVAVTVSPRNDVPNAVNDSLTVAEDAAATAVPVLANDSDADSDTLTITARTNGAHGTVAISAGGSGLTYQPNLNYSGPDSFTYTTSDGTATDRASVAVTVSPRNDVPNAVNDSLTVAEDAAATAVPVLANDSDADGDTLTITARTNGAHGTVAISAGGSGLTYDPVQLYFGSDVFTYTVSDGHGGFDTATVLLTVVKDATGPVVTAPSERFYNQTVGTSTTKARLTWSGTDIGGTGIASYGLQVSINGGSFSTIGLANPTSTSIDRTLTDLRSYRYRVRATDKQGNVGAYLYGPIFTPARIQNTHSNVTYTGSWSTTSNASALGGSHRFATSTSARASITRTVWDVAWVATKTPTSGSAEVWIDGALAATVNLRSSSNTYRQLVFQRHFTTFASHTVEIRPIGGGRVYLDAFLIYR